MKDESVIGVRLRIWLAKLIAGTLIDNAIINAYEDGVDDGVRAVYLPGQSEVGPLNAKRPTAAPLLPEYPR